MYMSFVQTLNTFERIPFVDLALLAVDICGVKMYFFLSFALSLPRVLGAKLYFNDYFFICHNYN